MNKRIVLVICLVMCSFALIFISWWVKKDKEDKMQIEYSKFEELEFGSSMEDSEKVLGEPDEWEGCGMLHPVYVLSDGTRVELFFYIPYTIEN